MEKLINAIKALLEHPDLHSVQSESEDEPVYIQRKEDTPEEIETLLDNVERNANEQLIETDGRCNWHNHKLLKELSGFYVVRGEYDSFGWLSGVIVTPKGRIVYG